MKPYKPFNVWLEERANKDTNQTMSSDGNGKYHTLLKAFPDKGSWEIIEHNEDEKVIADVIKKEREQDPLVRLMHIEHETPNKDEFWNEIKDRLPKVGGVDARLRDLTSQG